MSSRNVLTVERSHVLIGIICLVALATFVGCKDPIPREAEHKFATLSASVKKKMDKFLPERNLILVNYRAACELQSSKEFPIVGRIFVNYRGEDSPLDKSNPLRFGY